VSRDIVRTQRFGVVGDIDGPDRDHSDRAGGPRSKSNVARDYGVSRRWVQRDPATRRLELGGSELEEWVALSVGEVILGGVVDADPVPA
jgi:hypothetical protein